MFRLIVSAFMALSLLGASATAQAAPVDTKTAPFNLESIRLVKCLGPTGSLIASGTAFHVAHNRYLTAEHVIGDCTTMKDDETGKEFRVIRANKKQDYAILATNVDLDNTILKLSCEPFKKNREYESIGWAGGMALMDVTLKASEKYSTRYFIVSGKIAEGFRQLVGFIIPGMSGGPVIDPITGLVHGINNISWESKNLSWSRELADTSICKKS